MYESDFPAEVAAFLGTLRAEREEADYEFRINGDWDDIIAAQAILRAEKFCTKRMPGFSGAVSPTDESAAGGRVR